MTRDPVIVIFGAAVRPDGQPSGAMRARVSAALACAHRLGAADFMPTGAQGRFGDATAAYRRALIGCDWQSQLQYQNAILASKDPWPKL